LPQSAAARSHEDDLPLELLAERQPADRRDTPEAEAQRTLLLAVLRGALLDLIATGDIDRVTAAVEYHLRASFGVPG
jgi:hypothetical protein